MLVYLEAGSETGEVDAICADVGQQQRHSTIGVQDMLSPNEKRFQSNLENLLRRDHE